GGSLRREGLTAPVPHPFSTGRAAAPSAAAADPPPSGFWEKAGPPIDMRRRCQIGVATAARSTAAAPGGVSVRPAPSPATIGPPTAVPSGVATVSAALRAASTLGRFAVVVIDWESAYG